MPLLLATVPLLHICGQLIGGWQQSNSGGAFSFTREKRQPVRGVCIRAREGVAKMAAGGEMDGNGGGTRCPFTTLPCDGGAIHADGSIGCAFKATPDSVCEWMAELPEGESARDYYNELVMAAHAG